jgi:uncharacterized membrane protein
MYNDMRRADALGAESLRPNFTDEDQSKNKAFTESSFFAITYPDQARAAQVMATLKRIQSEKLIDLEDAVYVTKDEQGKVQLHQTHHTARKGALGGSLAGFIVGSILLTPIGGAAIGAATGAIVGKAAAKDAGIEDQFIKDLSEQMQSNSSAIFLLVRSVSAQDVVPQLGAYGGTIIETSLTAEAQARLQAALTPDVAATPDTTQSADTATPAE